MLPGFFIERTQRGIKKTIWPAFQINLQNAFLDCKSSAAFCRMLRTTTGLQF